MPRTTEYTLNGKSTVRNSLTAKEKFLFQAYLQQHYTEERMDDPSFAEKASKALNLPITTAMVGYSRREFGIPANQQHSGKGAQLSEILSRLEALEARMETLLRERREHFHGGRP